MTISVETLLVASLMMAVFAAVATVGSSLFLGAGYERLRAGLETLRKQTAYFSDALRGIDRRVESVEKQNRYFFEAIAGEEHAGSHISAGRDDVLRSRAETVLNDSIMPLWKAPGGGSLPEDAQKENLRFH